MFETIELANALHPLTSRVRTDVTAVKKKGQPIVWSKQSLTTNRLVTHIDGGVGRGVCPIKPGQDTTSVALLDFDSHGGETSFGDMIKVARAVEGELTTAGLAAMPFVSSGGRGIHLLLMWDSPQDAYTVRQTLFEVLGYAEYKNGTGGVAKGEIEVFPKQDVVPPGGFGNQFILPLHGKSEPIDLETGLKLGKEAVLTMDWPMSRPLPVRERPVRKLTKATPTGDLKKYADMLAAIDPDISYGDWLRCGMALHFESNGSPEGLMIFDEWSSGGTKYDGVEATTKKWDSFGGKENQVTGSSIEAAARSVGYVADILNDFERIDSPPGLEGGDIDNGNLAQRNTEIQRAGADAPAKAFMRFNRNDNGEILATAANLKLALSRSDFCGWQIRYDAFRDEIMFRELDAPVWRAFTDPDYFRLRVLLEHKSFKPIGRDLIRDAVGEAADTERFDSAIYWLNGLPAWDGVPRIDQFMSKYFGADDTPYTRAIGAYLWTGLAGRVLEPGCKADMVPIFVGKQGIRKSTAVAAIAPRHELFAEISFAEKDDDLARKMRGRLIAEIGELRGLHSRELETIKAFIARTHENWIPKFKEFGTIFPRRLIFIGTTNQDEFLADETGNRRWLPVRVVLADVDAIKRDRNQLWAEGRKRFLAGGVEWLEAERLAEAVHGEYTISDAWEGLITDYLHREKLDGKKPIDKGFVQVSEIAIEALAIDVKYLTRGIEMRIAKILKGIGFKKKKGRMGGKVLNQWLWESDPVCKDGN